MIAATDFDDFETWLQVGIDRGWVSKPVCATHDGIPSTEAEEGEWEDGGDPCQAALRIWTD